MLNQSYEIYIMPLLINSLRGGHTHIHTHAHTHTRTHTHTHAHTHTHTQTHTHTDVADKINFKKPVNAGQRLAYSWFFGRCTWFKILMQLHTYYIMN